MSNIFGPKIITNGLVCYYDAANYKCYNGSGPVVDISRNGNDTATMDSRLWNATSGVFTFTGGIGARTCGNASGMMPSAYSISIALQPVFGYSGNNTAMGIFGRTLFPGSGFALGMGQQPNFYNFFSYYTPAGGVSSAGWGTTAIPISYTSPDVICVTFQSNTGIAYKNGLVIASGTGGYSPISSSFIWGGHGQGGWTDMSGIVYNLMVYNRSLGSGEVLQNFNSLKSRYGLN